MELVDVYQNAVPKVLVSAFEPVVHDTGVVPNSVYRGQDAATILNRHGKHTQYQIVHATAAQRAAWGIEGTPNPVGRSTHECRSDGVAYPGPIGRPLADWQCGHDWPDSAITAVMAAFKNHGMIVVHPYPSGVEYHHLNIVRKPVIPMSFLPLHGGIAGKQHTSTGLWVYILTSRLKSCGYLYSRTSKYDKKVIEQVKHFQAKHHLTVDGITGVHTWLNLKAASAYCVKHKSRESFPV